MNDPNTTTPQDTISILKKAFIRLNMPVFPIHTIFDGRCTCGDPECKDQGKHPKVISWKDERTTNAGKIRDWIDQYGACNWGGATGKASGVFAVDIDPRHSGVETFNALETQHGKIPNTRMHKTGGGGVHIIFSIPAGVTIKNGSGVLGPGVDVKGDDGYIVLPPSRHISGGAYEILNDAPPAEPPKWLISLLLEKQNGDADKASPGFKMPDTIPAGARTTTLFSAARSMRAKGFSEPAVKAAIEIENKLRCEQPPVPDGKLQNIVKDAARNYSAGTITDTSLYELTEHGVAELIRSLYGANWFHLADAKEWYYWTGKHWELDTTLRINSLVKTVVIEKLTDAAIAGDKARRDFYSRCCDNTKTNNIVASCRSILAIPPEIVDAHTNLLPVENGTYDLDTHTFTPEHNREQYLTKVCPIEYNENATCEKWVQHINMVFEGNVSLIEFFQELTGYTLLHNNPEEIFIILWGAGKNGKTVTTKVLKKILGKYAKTAMVDTIMKSRIKGDGAGHRSDLVAIASARMVMIAEGNAEDELAAGLIKQMTGGDGYSVRGAYEKRPVEYDPGFKIYFVTNHLPMIDGADYGLMRRVFLIPFTATIQNRITEYDRVLFEEEGSGILRWMLEGLKRYQERGGFVLPDVVRSEIEKYRSSHDIISLWMNDECVRDIAAVETRSVIIGNYQNWCQMNKYPELKAKEFWGILVARGIVLDGVYVKRVRGCKGIRIKTHEELTNFYVKYERAATRAAEEVVFH